MTQTAHSPASSPAQPPSPSLTLTGLKAHHPLGFLAACGTLRAVTLQGWSDARLSWSSVTRGRAEQAPDSAAHAGECVAVLHSSHLGTDSTKAADTLIAALAAQAGADSAEKSERVTWLNWADRITAPASKNDQDRTKHRQLFQSIACAALTSDNPRNADTFAALASDALHAISLESSLLDLTSGNQSLLKSVRELAAVLTNGAELPTTPTNKLRDAHDAAHASFREALIGPWLYQNDDHSLGWDPSTQRLHALRNMVPEQDKANRSVRAAVFLASQALPLFPVFCSQGRPRTIGFARDRRGRDAASGQGRRTVGPSPTADRDDFFTWPVWDRPISFDTLRALLAHLSSPRLAARGVVALYQSRRAKTGGSQGDYRVLVQPTLQTLL